MIRALQIVFASTAVLGSACNSLLAEMYHRQLMEHNQSTPFLPKTGDILSALHTPVMTTERNSFGAIRGTVQIGLGNGGGNLPDGCPNNCVHPLSPSSDPDAVHYITTILIVDQDNEVVALGELTAEDTEGKVATLDFTATGAQTLTPYAYCSIHGFWQGKTTTFESEGKASTKCTVEKCQKEHLVNATISTVAALRHRQDLTYKTKDAFPIKDGDILNSLHRPVLAVIGNTATITIGLGSAGPDGCPNGCYHPVVPSTDPKEVHWPDFIYVVDQDGKIVLLRETSPTVPGTVTYVFPVPMGAKVLTPYVHCNIHGLFVGKPVTISLQGYAPDSVTCELFY